MKELDPSNVRYMKIARVLTIKNNLNFYFMIFTLRTQNIGVDKR